MSHQSQLAQQLQQPTPPVPQHDIPEVAAEETSTTGWTADPNEPRYCVCNDVSYGDMVGCDNDDVRYCSTSMQYLRYVLACSTPTVNDKTVLKRYRPYL